MESTVTPRRGSGPAAPTEEKDRHTGSITPQLVDEVAAKVYTLMLLDLKIEHERQCLPFKGLF